MLDFPAPPLAIGDKPVPVVDLAKKKRRTGVLTLLSPTHCVMDRLAAYYHWDDKQTLEQAVLVARRHPMKWAEIEGWSREEGMSEKFKTFKGLVKRKG